MAENENDIAACMLAHALIANTRSRQQATERAAKAVAKYPDGAYGRALWGKVRDLLRNGAHLPTEYKRHIPQIPSAHAVHYVRPEGYASGGAVESKKSKEEANYRHGTQERHCSACSMWIAPKGDDHHGGCTAVRGDIAPTALCDLFERAEPKGVHYERVGQQTDG